MREGVADRAGIGAHRRADRIPGAPGLPLPRRGGAYGDRVKRRAGRLRGRGQQRGAARREERQQNRPRARERRLRLRAQRPLFLIVEDRGAGRNSAGAERFGEIRGGMRPAQMQQRAGRSLRPEQAQERRRVASGLVRRNPRRPRRRCGLCAHAPGRQVAPGMGCDKGAHPVFGGEDQPAHPGEVDRRRARHDFEHRREDRLDRREARCAGLAKARAGLARPGDKQDRHGLRRRCGIVRDHTGCYLPEYPHATGVPMGDSLTFLGLESSCDDTAAAVLCHASGSAPEILSNVVMGQAELHAAHGGIVPEIAARAHAEKLDLCAERALAKAGLGLDALDGVAVTAGPGLIGGVLAGVMCAKGIAAGAGLPLVGVNHLAGHALTPRLTDGLEFPYLVLLVSGGHCQFVSVRGAENYARLGATIDDAPGEAFDKVARLLGLAQPGGPAVEAAARQGDAARFRLPRPLLDRPGCDMSFSGLKTAVLRARDDLVAARGGLTAQDRADLCAAFQGAMRDVLAEKSRRAIAASAPGARAFAVAGGVAANRVLRAALGAVAEAAGTRFVAPPPALCTDNAAMIAWAGIERFRAGARDGLDLAARPRWPLDAAAPAALGGGRKGAKA